MTRNDSADDRRDPVLREALLTNLRQELQHVPGLALTLEQMSRLFNIPQDACSRLLAVLVREGVIRVRSDGRHTLAAD
jgi:DNA-binding IclR family transcriptional regulator